MISRLVDYIVLDSVLEESLNKTSNDMDIVLIHNNIEYILSYGYGFEEGYYIMVGFNKSIKNDKIKSINTGLLKKILYIQKESCVIEDLEIAGISFCCLDYYSEHLDYYSDIDALLDVESTKIENNKFYIYLN